MPVSSLKKALNMPRLEPESNFADVSIYAAEGPSSEGLTWVGRSSERSAPYPVNEAQIGYYCSLVEDANENYWNREAAEQR